MTKYSKKQIALHWLITALFIAQFVFADSISHAFRGVLKGEEIVFDPLIAAHVFGGALIGFLTIYRFYVRRKTGVPPYPAQESKLTKLASEIVHYGTYILAILLPVSGAVAWFGVNKNAGEAHEIMKGLLVALVVLHVAGTAFHIFVKKNNILKRMSYFG